MEEKIEFIFGIARGILHLHESQIIHRDLASRNILLDNNRTKISDFGMSRKLKGETEGGSTLSTVGPLRWMAPESLGDKIYSKKSDIWTFGIVLYEIVARKSPHLGEDQLGIGLKIRDEGYTPIIPEDCPPALKEIMEMCWKKNPEERPLINEICQKLEKSFSI